MLVSDEKTNPKMKRIKDKLWSRKQLSKDNSVCLASLAEASQLLTRTVSQKAAESLAHRRVSVEEQLTSSKLTASSCSLNLERHRSAYEIGMTEDVCPAGVGSYRRMESRECMELAASTGSLPGGVSGGGKNKTPASITPRAASLDREAFVMHFHRTHSSHSYKMKRRKSAASKKDQPATRAPRSNSLDTGNFNLYVGSLLRDASEPQENGRAPGLAHTSDDDSDRTPTDVTPTGSSTSLTPTGSREDILLGKRVWKRFSRRWLRRSTYSLAEGEWERRRGAWLGVAGCRDVLVAGIPLETRFGWC